MEAIRRRLAAKCWAGTLGRGTAYECLSGYVTPWTFTQLTVAATDSEVDTAIIKTNESKKREFRDMF